jgi:hypothetical protein
MRIKMTFDPVKNPKHYTEGSKIQPIDLFSDWHLDPFSANVIKYLRRAPYKGTEIQDLKKAAFYLNKLIELKEAGWNYNKSSTEHIPQGDTDDKKDK